MNFRFCIAALAAAPCFAQELPAELDPIVITATGSEQHLSEVAPSVEVITRQDIERLQANDLGELLRAVAGVDVARTGGPGSPASVFIRGAESNHTLFMVDGVRFTTETFLNAQIQNLAPEMIERIEIVKGPRSALWGSDAIGGVVHVITRRARDGLHGRASLRAEPRYGGSELGAGVGYRGSRGELALDAESQSFDGFPPLQSGGEDRGHKNLSATLSGALELGPARLGARHLHADGTTEYVDPFGGAPLAQDFVNRVSAVELSAPVTDAWRARLTASLAHDEIVQRQPSDPARPRLRDFTEVDRRSAGWENQLLAGPVALVAGLEAGSSEIDSAFYSGFGDSRTQDESKRRAGYAQAQAALAGFDLLAAARYTDHNRFGGHTTGQAEVAREFGSTRLAVAAGTAFKEPELTDLYGMFGNPELDPERSTSFEVNVRQPLAGRHVLTAAAYQTRIDDLVVFDLATFAPANLGRARIRGIEAGWRYDDGLWSGWLSGNRQQPEDRDTGERLLRRSSISGQAGARRRFGVVYAQLDAIAHGNRKDVGDATLAGYALCNAAVGVAPAPGWSLGVRADNLLDRDYELVDGFRTAGRTVSVALHASF